MRVGPVSKIPGFLPLLAAAAVILMTEQASAQTTLEIGIGTQNTTTNTVTGGVVLKELGLLEKHLPKTGKYKDVKYKLTWQNFTSGPPITNGMMANKHPDRHDGRLPAAGERRHRAGAPSNETQLVAIIAYNAFGGGNGIVVHKDSPFYELADLKGKNCLGAVRLRRARHDAAGDAEARAAGGLLEPGRADRPRSAPPTCRKSASTRTAISFPSPNCCRSAASPARSSTAPRPRCRPSTAWSCARISPRSIPRSSSPTSRR